MRNLNYEKSSQELFLNQAFSLCIYIYIYIYIYKIFILGVFSKPEKFNTKNEKSKER